MLWMLLTTITIILLVAFQSMFGSTTHALPWAFVSTLMLLNIVEKQ